MRASHTLPNRVVSGTKNGAPECGAPLLTVCV
jgi:hypothetical protein